MEIRRESVKNPSGSCMIFHDFSCFLIEGDHKPKNKITMSWNRLKSPKICHFNQKYTIFLIFFIFGLFKNRKPILGFFGFRFFRDFQNFKIFDLENLMRPKYTFFLIFFNNFFGWFKNRKLIFGFYLELKIFSKIWNFWRFDLENLMSHLDESKKQFYMCLNVKWLIRTHYQ